MSLSTPHESLHRIFREDTSLLPRALDRILGLTLPKVELVTVEESDCTEAEAVTRRVDTLLTLTTTDNPYIAIIESQRGKDPEKPKSWAYYISYLMARHKAATPILVVVCQSRATARWVRRTHSFGIDANPCLTLRALVFGPDNVPIITNVDEACRDLMLAVFSTLVHARERTAGAILETVKDAVQTLAPLEAQPYLKILDMGLASTPVYEQWRAHVTAMAEDYTTPLQREWSAAALDQGRNEGIKQGRDEGQTEATRSILLDLLAEYGFAITDRQRELITTCTDHRILRRWIKQLPNATTVDEVFS